MRPIVNIRRGPSHGHRQQAQKIGKDRACGSGDILSDRETNLQTDILITILRNRSSGRSKYLIIAKYSL